MCRKFLRKKFLVASKEKATEAEVKAMRRQQRRIASHSPGKENVDSSQGGQPIPDDEANPFLDSPTIKVIHSSSPRRLRSGKSFSPICDPPPAHLLETPCPESRVYSALPKPQPRRFIRPSGASVPFPSTLPKPKIPFYPSPSPQPTQQPSPQVETHVAARPSINDFIVDYMDFEWENYEEVAVNVEAVVNVDAGANADDLAFIDDPMSFDSVRDDPMEWEWTNILDFLDYQESPGHGYHLRPRRKAIHYSC